MPITIAALGCSGCAESTDGVPPGFTRFYIPQEPSQTDASTDAGQQQANTDSLTADAGADVGDTDAGEEQPSNQFSTEAGLEPLPYADSGAAVAPDVQAQQTSMPEAGDPPSEDAGLLADVLSSDASPVWGSLCSYANGSDIPRDHTEGIVSEYAYALSKDCTDGGYLAPIVALDPERLSGVLAFTVDVTTWLRADVLHCPGEAVENAPRPFALLPLSQSTDMSRRDFDASIALFMAIVSRHDSRPDGLSAQKPELLNRLKAFADTAVKLDSTDPTKPLAPPSCVPTPG